LVCERWLMNILVNIEKIMDKMKRGCGGVGIDFFPEPSYSNQVMI
jgi:hypothetical protein